MPDVLDPAELPQEATPHSRLLAAAGGFAAATSEVVETARALNIFQFDLEAYQARPTTALIPCSDAQDQAADAIVQLYFALREPEELRAFAEAAAAWTRGEH
jgi:hypothetical protein